VSLAALERSLGDCRLAGQNGKELFEKPTVKEFARAIIESQSKKRGQKNSPRMVVDLKLSDEEARGVGFLRKKHYGC